MNNSDPVIHLSQTTRDIGIWLDNQLSIDQHIAKVCQGYFVQIRSLDQICRYLTVKSAAIISAAIVATKLGYYNSLFIGASAAQLHRLQRVQNSLARVIYRNPCHTYITPVLRRLH